MLLDPSPATGATFASRLREFGDRPALISTEGRLGYADLADRVAARAEVLGPERRLVLLAAGNDVETVVTYLAALLGGHPVLPVSADQPENLAGLLAAYDPDVVARGADLTEVRPGTAHRLHPDLALLLSTSGSTGSPKLVRLGSEGLQANAAAIADYLGIRDTDVAATTLPLHYCYGLSVLNSHLLRGAAVLLTDLSVVDPCFWDLVRRHGVTTFPGVPHTFDLLDRVGFAGLDLPSLRYLTQAGGRMAPEVVRRYAELGQRRGFDLVVMYGQTEATARMAYLPPDLAATRPEAVGVPVPGGRFALAPVPDAGPGVGELVYSGPNVMLGYAEGPADLARGREVTELRTGDLARIADDGLVEVVGRRGRTAKLFGLRVDLDGVERLLEDAGTTAYCSVADDVLVVQVPGRDGARRPAVRAGELVRRRTGLPARAVRVQPVAEVPRLPNGKPDRPALARLAAAAEPAPVAAAGDVRSLYAALLGRPDASHQDSFVSLGGDSLSYVEVSTRLEQLLGHLPPGWHLLPARELEGRRAEQDARERGPRLHAVETNVVLRALAIVAIVGTHGNLFVLTGGAHLLLGVAGFNLARFSLAGTAGERCRRILTAAARVAAPALVWIGAVTVLTGHYPWRTALLVNGLVGPPDWSEPAWHYWFVEALLAILVGVAVLLAIPALDRWQRRHPFWFPVALAVLALLTRYEVVVLRDGDVIHRAHVVFWLFALGWAAAAAARTRHRLLLSALAAASVPGFFGDAAREAVVVVGMLLLVWVPHLRLPGAAARPVGWLAGASLFVYLTHWQVYPHLEDEAPLAAVLLSLSVGVLAWRAWEALTAVLGRQRRTGQRRAASGGAVSAWSPASSTGREPGTTLTDTRVPTG